MLLSPAGSNAGLPASPGSGFWSKLKPGGGKNTREADLRQQQQPQMALSRQRLLTLVHGDMETVRMLPNTFVELDGLARDWAKPPPDALFSLRVPIDYVHIQTARLVSGDYVYLTGEDSYQIATMGVPGLRVEIVSDAPPPPDEPPHASYFNLELNPGRHDVDGNFWGKLTIVHDGDNHTMDFSGTRLLGEDVTPDLMVDQRVITKLAVAAKPSVAKCRLTLLSPAMQYCDVVLSCSSMWKMGITWPPAEPVGDGKVKYFLRVHPGGGFEHFESEMVATAIYYEAMPEPSLLDPNEFVAPRNSFAMSFADFVPHLMNVMDQLGMSVHARTDFINTHIHEFSKHRNIAYRFLSPGKIAAAIDMTLTADPCVFTRIFLIFRGIPEDDMEIFSGAGEKEANAQNWREVVGWTENSKDASLFRVLETSVLEVG
ncbi:hypothetical protein BGY98DRAFT_952691 [Russula aff. rugulosa BPL654]|nr:hypothetical protein BGY98DRAFT_952691 [Russula aff. rugulosa BPL654]